MPALQIIPGDFANGQVKALLEYHLRGMHASSPPGHVFALDWSALQSPEIAFFTGWLGQRPVVMGALKNLGGGAGELKSMRVAAGEAGKGHGAAMLRHLIAAARARGMRRLSLETGTGQPFAAAEALYRAYGFTKGEKFADYEQSDFCQF
ncbi:MAG: GNAT family N-acetyltransferase, partial [Alphaproteobacteria bacterium]|nr:GNAT family N-acetyltransferase [Alphaproteobacteria bacterium]